MCVQPIPSTSFGSLSRILQSSGSFQELHGAKTCPVLGQDQSQEGERFPSGPQGRVQSIHQCEIQVKTMKFDKKCDSI